MKPVLILQHEEYLGPGSLLDCLRQRDIPLMVLRPELGQNVPVQAQDYSGLVLLGSERDVRDELPWIHAELRLCASALAFDVPVLGHAFGAQLLAQAAGAHVLPSPCPSVGWSDSLLTPDGRERFGAPAQVTVFNAHAHSFELPRGARRLMFDRRSHNKAFALGPHLGLQCHLELSEAGLRDWCARSGTRLARARGPDVQTRIEMLRDLPARMVRLNQLARRVYGHWCRQLPRAPRAASC